MASPKTSTIVQPDLFGAPAVAGAVVEVPPAPKPTRRRKVHETQRAGHARIQSAGPSITQRVEWDVKGNGRLGRTRQEIADRTGIPINTVCGCIDRLLKAHTLFEPVVDYEGPHPVHYLRDGRKVVVDALYHDTHDWLAFGQLLQQQRTPAA